MSNLKLVTTSELKRATRSRPYTSYYFKRDQMRPLRVSRSTSVAAALCAIIRRIADGEPIRVAEIVNSNGKVVKTVLVHYRKIEIK
jgi:flavin-binding protein dodecin